MPGLMLNRTLQNRVERAEQAAKSQSKHSADCICFPENEPPFFAFEIELKAEEGTPPCGYVPGLVGGERVTASRYQIDTASDQR
jgi:hypothetical protein